MGGIDGNVEGLASRRTPLTARLAVIFDPISGVRPLYDEGECSVSGLGCPQGYPPDWLDAAEDDPAAGLGLEEYNFSRTSAELEAGDGL
jgi:hypothetical protein